MGHEWMSPVPYATGLPPHGRQYIAPFVARRLTAMLLRRAHNYKGAQKVHTPGNTAPLDSMCGASSRVDVPLN